MAETPHLRRYARAMLGDRAADYDLMQTTLFIEQQRARTCYYLATMPTIEFNGYTVDEAERMRDRVRGRLADLPFCKDIVFVKQGPSQVIAWDGSERPFIRVLTRTRERADRIRDRLTNECDLEIVLIDFIPRATG